jgi:enterochelin esterase-like enzyme
VKLLIATFWLALADGGAPTVPPSVPRPPADTLVSPEVSADGRVTFRLRAPRATEVTVAGEWSRPGGAPNAPQKLVRAGELWSLTVGPLPPNIYIYVFNVDGMTITDPVNPLVKLRARTSASMVEVPGGEPWEPRPVPHGTVHVTTHASPVLGGAIRQIFVYTPPGYEKGRKRYPVLYLLHGNNDLAAGWTLAGRANLILDNLIAAKQAVPMIVVMPWGHALPFGTRSAPGQPSNNDVFERYLLQDVVPLIEGTYRIAPGRTQRAVAGLSMGGAQSLQLGLRHPDRFASVGVFGAGSNQTDFEARFKDAPATPKPALFYIGVGQEDGVLPRAKDLSTFIRARGVTPTYEEVSGGHTYPVWRKLLVAFAPLLFR